MKIEVTKRDIQKGERGSCRWCPVARAVARATNYKKLVLVASDHVDINDKDFNLPLRVQRFITCFDMGDDVKPFSFNLGRARAL